MTNQSTDKRVKARHFYISSIMMEYQKLVRKENGSRLYKWRYSGFWCTTVYMYTCSYAGRCALRFKGLTSVLYEYHWIWKPAFNVKLFVWSKRRKPAGCEPLLLAFSVNLLFHDIWIISPDNRIEEPAEHEVDRSIRCSFVFWIVGIFWNLPISVQCDTDHTWKNRVDSS